MTDREHRYSEGQGFDDPYEGFDLDPPELEVDPSKVDPVDSHVLTDLLDEHHVKREDVSVDELIDIGLSYMSINRHEQAADTFERAAQFAEEDSLLEQEAWINKAIAHVELEEYHAAIDDFRAALHVDDESEHAPVAETNLAGALFEVGEDEEAFRHAERAVRLDDRLGQAWYNLGFIQAEHGHLEDAVECLDNAIRLGFHDAAAFEEKARALDELGEEEEAEAAAERAAEIRERTEQRLIE